MMDALVGKKLPLPSYLSEEDRNAMSEVLLKGGLTAPTSYYKTQLNGDRLADDRSKSFQILMIKLSHVVVSCSAGIPKERYIPPTSSPIFYGGGLEDSVCYPSMQKQVFDDPRFKDHQVTTREYAGGHWFILSHANDINTDLALWIESIAA